MITNGYVTLADVKARLDIAGSTSDTTLEQMVEAASRQIDGWTARTFFTVVEARLVTADHPMMIQLPFDLAAITTLAVDDGNRTYTDIWQSTDYEVDDPAPYRTVYVARGSGRLFPTWRNAIKITGSWGYSTSIPPAIREATALLVGRLYKRKDAPFGVAGNADHGEIQTLPGLDPDVKQLVWPYRRFGFTGV